MLGYLAVDLGRSATSKQQKGHHNHKVTIVLLSQTLNILFMASVINHRSPQTESSD